MSDPIVNYNQGNVNAVDRAIGIKLDDMLSVKDFGAVGDGVTDDSSAITNAIAAAQDSGSLKRGIFFPKGEYLISSDLSIDSPFCFIGESATTSKLVGQSSSIVLATTSNIESIIINRMGFDGFTRALYNTDSSKTIDGLHISDCIFANNKDAAIDLKLNIKLCNIIGCLIGSMSSTDDEVYGIIIGDDNYEYRSGTVLEATQRKPRSETS